MIKIYLLGSAEIKKLFNTFKHIKDIFWVFEDKTQKMLQRSFLQLIINPINKV
jgi:hypothetical protein